jgi:hypothetical protein
MLKRKRTFSVPSLREMEEQVAERVQFVTRQVVPEESYGLDHDHPRADALDGNVRLLCSCCTRI